MTSLRPTVFIGSSSEGLKIAEAIQLNLDHPCEATVWSQGIFGLSGGTLESLVARLDGFDFAVLVLTPDDLTISRGETNHSPRDNVLLELGLFIGALGPRRTFIVHERDKPLKLPSDLAGVTPATFMLHSDGNLQASLGAVTTLIKRSIQQSGRRHEKISADISDATQFQIIHDLIDNSLEQFIIWMAESDKSLHRDYRYFGVGVRYEYALRSRAGGQGSFYMDVLCEKLPDAGLLHVDLRNDVTLTERGKQFARWLTENGHRAIYFRSDIGGWGTPPDDSGFPWPGGNPWRQDKATGAAPTNESPGPEAAS